MFTILTRKTFQMQKLDYTSQEQTYKTFKAIISLCYTFSFAQYLFIYLEIYGILSCNKRLSDTTHLFIYMDKL